MGTSQIIVREQHGDHLRLVCYAVGTSHTWDSEWKDYSPQEVRYVKEYHRYFSGIYRTLLRYLPREGEVLEAGAGLGHWVALLDEAGFRARGMDYSDEALAQARRTFPDLRFDRGDVLALPYPDASLSGYVSFGVAEHFRDGPGAMLTEAGRVLRPGGILILSVPYVSPLRRLQPSEQDESEREKHFYQYFFEAGEFEGLVTAHGFRVLAHTHYGSFKTLRDVWRSLHRQRRSADLPANAAAKVGRCSSPASKAVSDRLEVTALKRLSWFVQNLVFENFLSRRLAGHMLLLVAERE